MTAAPPADDSSPFHPLQEPSRIKCILPELDCFPRQRFKALSGEVRWEEQDREKPAVQSWEEEGVPGQARWERISSGARTPSRAAGVAWAAVGEGKVSPPMDGCAKGSNGLGVGGEAFQSC